MDSKSLAGIEIKDETKGEVEAVFATLNVKDKDDDVTLPGAFENGASVVISSYNHKSWEGALPVGKGTIYEVGDKVIMKGQFFMDTAAGRDTFAVIKHLGNRQEWSYGFKVEDSEQGDFKGESVRMLKKMAVYEVSPVMRGAGVGTQTTYAKAADDEDVYWKRNFTAAQRHRMAQEHTAMPDGSFPIANEEDLHNAIRAIGRAKNPAAARAHIIRRARAMGMMDAIPSDWTKSLNEEISFAVAAVRDAVESAERVAALRAENGKSLSNVNYEGLGELSEVMSKLNALLDTEQKNETADDAELYKLYLESVKATLEGE